MIVAALIIFILVVTGMIALLLLAAAILADWSMRDHRRSERPPTHENRSSMRENRAQQHPQIVKPHKKHPKGEENE